MGGVSANVCDKQEEGSIYEEVEGGSYMCCMEEATCVILKEYSDISGEVCIQLVAYKGYYLGSRQDRGGFGGFYVVDATYRVETTRQ